MERYKPGYLGKVIPADNPDKLTDFVTNKYDSFSKIYDACKDQSEQIADVKAVESTAAKGSSLSVKVSCEPAVMECIKEAAKGDGSITVKNDVITAI